MVSCQICGRSLSDPRSVERMIGPVCWKKFERGEVDKLEKIGTPEDIELERKIIIFLHKHTKLIATSRQYRRKHERALNKQKFLWVNDYSYHSFDRMIHTIQNNKGQYASIIWDSGYPKSKLYVRLMRKKNENLEVYF